MSHRVRGAAAALTAGTLVVVSLGGCERRGSARATGAPAGASATASPTALPPPAATSTWNDSLAGPELFVAGGSPSDAVDVLPHYTDSSITDAPSADSLLDRHPHVDLFTRGGQVGTATLTPAASGNFSGSCTTWPTAHVTVPEGPPPDWSVAFTKGHATALPMDSIPVLSPQDSARRAAEIARVASALPNDTAAAFRGLPFSVRDAHRFVLPSGDTVIAAEVVRRLNQEDNPEEEHIILLLERDTTARAGNPGSSVAAYSERTSGPEDDVESAEVLAGVMLGRGSQAVPTLIVGRDYGDGNSYTLIQRTGPHVWRARWNSAYVGC